MDKIKIQTVCGFGCGSSLFLRMKIEEVLKENNIKADVFCGDVGTCLSQPCDAIFISKDLYSRIEDRAKVTVVPSIISWTRARSPKRQWISSMELIKNKFEYMESKRENFEFYYQ